MLHCVHSTAIRTAAHYCFSRRCTSSSQQLIGGVRTLATRRTPTDAGRGKEHSALKYAAVDVDTTSEGWPHPIYASTRTEAKKSIFAAHVSRLPSASPSASLHDFLDHLTAQPALKRATHCMYAWRAVSQPGSDANTEPGPGPGMVLTGQSDGGESGAGERLARLLESTGSTNVVVVVSRWYGGVKLGSERWKMISAVAKDALARGDFREDRPSIGTDTGTTPTNAKAKGYDNNKKRKR